MTLLVLVQLQETIILDIISRWLFLLMIQCANALPNSKMEVRLLNAAQTTKKKKDGQKEIQKKEEEEMIV